MVMAEDMEGVAEVEMPHGEMEEQQEITISLMDKEVIIVMVVMELALVQEVVEEVILVLVVMVVMGAAKEEIVLKCHGVEPEEEVALVTEVKQVMVPITYQLVEQVAQESLAEEMVEMVEVEMLGIIMVPGAEAEALAFGVEMVAVVELAVEVVRMAAVAVIMEQEQIMILPLTFPYG